MRANSYGCLAGCFRRGAIDTVTTSSFEAPPDEVWQTMMFYEEVPPPPAAAAADVPAESREDAGKRQAGGH